ncbi:MAG: hypothetical protein M1833_000529 [Piccolia ochrophora]|nr:MAG: hypothetical protein M1833_000529 [Piccolia ochrophora]
MPSRLLPRTLIHPFRRRPSIRLTSHSRSPSASLSTPSAPPSDPPPPSTHAIGTAYEHLVLRALTRLHFTLQHTGRSRDLGIDLLGQFQPPSLLSPLPVLVQCKHVPPSPSLVRELEGAFAGAPAGGGWRGERVWALLVCNKPATRGVLDGVGRGGGGARGMGFAMVDDEGVVRQLVWNAVVAGWLGDVGVGVRFGGEGEQAGKEVVLVDGGRVVRDWDGKGDDVGAGGV